jgi:hypothetical protein
MRFPRSIFSDGLIGMESSLIALPAEDAEYPGGKGRLDFSRRLA